MAGGRRTVQEASNFLSPYQAAEKLGLTLSQFKNRVHKKLLPQPTKVISNRWNFDQTYIDKVLTDPKYANYVGTTAKVSVPERAEAAGV